MVSSHAPPWITWSKVKCRMPSNFREEWWPHSEADRTACFQGIVTHTALHESMVKRIYGLCHLVLINSQNTTIASRPCQKNSRLKVILIMGTKRIEQRLLLPAGALCQLPCLKQKTKQSTYNQMTINQVSRRPYEIWLCVCVCVYIYIYIYTHTHTYIYMCAGLDVCRSPSIYGLLVALVVKNLPANARDVRVSVQSLGFPGGL